MFTQMSEEGGCSDAICTDILVTKKRPFEQQLTILLSRPSAPSLSVTFALVSCMLLIRCGIYYYRHDEYSSRL